MKFVSSAASLVTLLCTFTCTSPQPVTGAPVNGVPTSSGLLQGHRAPRCPAVTEYLGVPFARPPVGNLRFAAPRAYHATGVFQASRFVGSADCPANVATSSIAGGPVPLVGPTAARLIDATQQFRANLGEDCLRLNIWANHGSGSKSKAVLFWLYGGGFTKGTTNSFLYDGQYLANTQDVIVVSANYRVSVFGFPGLPGMDQNVGLLDQRLAIGWVRENIAAFGGDPNRITLFGQSAGAASIDYYSFAWTSDPIVNGFIAESGVATSFSKPAPPDNRNTWYSLSEALGCGGASAGPLVTLDCVRDKSMQQILAATATLPSFLPTADNKLVFSDYASLGRAGRFIRKPMLLGNNDYEAGIIKVIFGAQGRTMPLQQWATLNLQTFTCPVANAALYRAMNNVPVWRYRYYGEFPNLRLTANPSSGAWHGSEIANVFGTAQLAGLPNTPEENYISRYMMQAWAAFAKYPTSALAQPPFSWPHYDPRGNTLVRLAYDNQTTPSFISPITYDYACAPILAPGGPDMAALSRIANLTQLGGGSEIGY
ncbi:hypothetical protein G7Y79_00067g095600 [Physcia stellaris]|nr:hypothetical protein G7Y79_00067g095600 [Physcia stellaris]